MQNVNKSMMFGLVALTVSIFFFGWDILDDLANHVFNGLAYKDQELIHLLFEILAFASLLYAVWILKLHNDLLSERTAQAESTVTVYQEGAGTLLKRKLEEVQLSQAEKEIAILILKGLSPSEIAELRGTAVGTVKTQTTSIFKKMKVKSRAELLSQLIYDILDLDSIQK